MSVRWSNAIWSAPWRETGHFTFARIRSAVRHCRVKGTERLCVTLWVTSTLEAVIWSGTRKDELSPSPKTLFFF